MTTKFIPNIRHGSVLCVGLNRRSAAATHLHLDRSAVPVCRIDEIRAEFSALHKNQGDQAASRGRFERAIRDKADFEMDYQILHPKKESGTFTSSAVRSLTDQQSHRVHRYRDRNNGA